MRRLALTVLLWTTTAVAVSCPPTFGTYPSAAWVPGHARPLLDTPDKQMFRTMIRLGAQSGEPFADRYRLATWGCGTACWQSALVDTRSGQVIPAPDANLGYAAKAGSRLLVVSPLGEEESMAERGQMAIDVPPRYYVLQGSRFVQVCNP